MRLFIEGLKYTTSIKRFDNIQYYIIKIKTNKVKSKIKINKKTSFTNNMVQTRQSNNKNSQNIGEVTPTKLKKMLLK